MAHRSLEHGAFLLSWITRSHWIARSRRPVPGSPEWEEETRRIRAELAAIRAAYDDEDPDEADAAILAADAAATASAEAPGRPPGE